MRCEGERCFWYWGTGIGSKQMFQVQTIKRLKTARSLGSLPIMADWPDSKLRTNCTLELEKKEQLPTCTNHRVLNTSSMIRHGRLARFKVQSFKLQTNCTPELESKRITSTVQPAFTPSWTADHGPPSDAVPRNLMSCADCSTRLPDRPASCYCRRATRQASRIKIKTNRATYKHKNKTNRAIYTQTRSKED